MPIVGHGIDLVEIPRIARLYADHAQHFLDRCFTPAEQAYCLSYQFPAERLAGRFAAKEALLKALGTGWRGQIAWTDIHITSDAAGKPGVQLTGECARIAAAQKIVRWHVSISHTQSHAMASVIAES